MLRDWTNSWKAFSASCWLWKHFPAKRRQVLEEVVVGLRKVRWIWQMRQNFVAQLVQLLKHWLCDMRSGVVEKNWALSVDQCWLQTLYFFVHLIDLLSLLLRCNCFAGIQKAVVDQTHSRPPNIDLDLFWVQFGFAKCCEAFSQSNHWAILSILSVTASAPHCFNDSLYFHYSSEFSRLSSKSLIIFLFTFKLIIYLDMILYRIWGLYS